MKKENKRNGRVSILGFSDLRSLCIAALLCAAAIVIAYLCKFLTLTSSIRITFENLPIIMCGYVFGPIPGLLCGLSADTLSTAVSYGFGGINPILTLGAGSVGFVAGAVSYICRSRKESVRLFISVFAAHITGNILIKSYGLWLYYHSPLPMLAVRIPLYITIAAIEYILLGLLLRSRGIKKVLGGVVN